MLGIGPHSSYYLSQGMDSYYSHELCQLPLVTNEARGHRQSQLTVLAQSLLLFMLTSYRDQVTTDADAHYAIQHKYVRSGSVILHLATTWVLLDTQTSTSL